MTKTIAEKISLLETVLEGIPRRIRDYKSRRSDIELAINALNAEIIFYEDMIVRLQDVKKAQEDV